MPEPARLLQDTATALEHYHDLAMTPDNPLYASIGRLGKHVSNTVENWLAEEEQHGASPAELLQAANICAVQLFLSVLANMIKTGKRAEAARVLRPAWITAYDGAVNQLGEE